MIRFFLLFCSLFLFSIVKSNCKRVYLMIESTVLKVKFNVKVRVYNIRKTAQENVIRQEKVYKFLKCKLS